MFPVVERAVAATLAGGKVVAPVDVIVRLGPTLKRQGLFLGTRRPGIG
jgi:hypothetical protein